MSDVTKRITKVAHEIESELESMPIEDHAAIVEILRVYTQRRAIAVQQEMQKQIQMASAVRAGQCNPHIVTEKA